MDEDAALSPSELVATRNPFRCYQPGTQAAVEIKMQRDFFAVVAERINQNTPPGRYRTLALTALEEACHWAVKALIFTDPQAVER